MDKRLAVALGGSLALHALLLALLRTGDDPAQQGNPKKPLLVYLQADAPPPPAGPDTGQQRQGAGRRNGLAHAPALLPEIVAEDRYLLPGEVDMRAQPVEMPDLVYPEQAQRMRVSGLVKLRVYIGKSGKIDMVDVVAATPPGMFEAAALQALLSTSFTPAKKNGHSVKSQKLIEIKFDPYEVANQP